MSCTRIVNINKRTFLGSFLNLLLLLILPVLSWSVPIEQVPKPTSKPVIDEANYLSDEEEAKLINQITSVHKNLGDNIVVVTLPSISDTQLSAKDYATQLFNTWHIGDKDKDSGLLILCIADIRRVEIETGYGLEGVLPDAVIKRIELEQIVPAFKQGEYAQGLYQGIQQINTTLMEEQQSQPIHLIQTKNSIVGYLVDYFTISLIFLLIFFAGFIYHKSQNRYQLVQTNTHHEPNFDTDKKIFSLNKNKVFVLEGCIFYGLGIILPILLFFYWWIFTPASFLLSFEYALSVSAVAKIVASLLTYRHATSWDSYWKKSDLDPPYFYHLTKPQYTKIDYVLQAILSPWFILFIKFWLSKQRKIRSQPRTCPKCQNILQKIPNENISSFLTDFAQHEINHNFAEYDVWVCKNCDYCKTLRFALPAAPEYSKCPNCQQQSYYLANSKLEQEATEQQHGLKINEFHCLLCGVKNNKEIVLPRLAASSHSSSSSGSDSSSSSTSSSGYDSSDGGSSGGGGAGSDY